MVVEEQVEKHTNVVGMVIENLSSEVEADFFVSIEDCEVDNLVYEPAKQVMLSLEPKESKKLQILLKALQ